jgi:hypothetical protein
LTWLVDTCLSSVDFRVHIGHNAAQDFEHRLFLAKDAALLDWRLHMAWDWNMFLLGVVGALAPEVVRLYGMRNDPNLFKWSWFYVIVSLVFVSLGGFVAVLLPAKNPQGAFYAGISTPVLINTAVKKGSGPRKLKGVPAAAPATSPFKSFVMAL